MNKFLDLANEEVFLPKDLFAMVVTYKPGDDKQPNPGRRHDHDGSRRYSVRRMRRESCTTRKKVYLCRGAGTWKDEEDK